MLGSQRNNKLISIANLIGYYLIIVGVAILLAIFFGIILFLNEIDIKLPINYNPILLIISYSPFACWLLFTGIGIIRKKSWARYSIIVFSYFSIFIGFVFFVTFYYLPIQKDISYLKTYKMIFLLVIILFFVLLPFWFLTFFNSKDVKHIFAPKQNTLSSDKPPFGVVLVALVMFLNSLFLLFYAILPSLVVPLPCNLFLSGFLLKIICISLAFLSFYIMRKLLALKKSGWLGCVIYNSISVMFNVLSFFNIKDEKLLEIAPFLFDSPAEVLIFYYRLFYLISIGVALAILVYIISRRKIFYKKDFSKI
ncbi:MAG: hypothetical protein NC918_05670 [Candidatus Omnitrophica bacterium]|nr:hypothetical protein [Candidatus Omnitrophota bacterium]